MPRCDVVGCGQAADVEVILYDVYPDVPTVFFQRDYTCSFLCYEHMVENEKGADGVRRRGGLVIYPYTNRHRARGFTIYRPLPEDD